jgi:adenosine 3'-phospho 5'-phosphosulfate transporter B3
VLGLFFFYVVHDALQERAFRSPGFAFGWFMTAVELGTMFAGAALFEGRPEKRAEDAAADEGHRRAKRRALVALVVFIAVSQGTGSVALNHVSYPVKVAFKSCKLVPTMCFSTCLTGRRYGASEYAAALLMCAALAILGLAEAHAGGAASQYSGFLLLAVATCSDAVIPNLQERLLRTLRTPTREMVAVSNAGSFSLVLAYCASTGELRRAVDHCRRVPDAAALLLLQALAAYAGLRCYLRVIKALSGVAGVLTTSARKLLTLVLSFLLFEKPFNSHHALGFALLVLGVGLAVAARHRGGS